MSTSLSGILLSKVLFKERDILATLLLKNGQKIKVVFYGGAGGGSKKKGSTLELGYSLKVELVARPPKEGLFTAKEWSVHWAHKFIRSDHQAFYLLCLFLEIIDHTSELQVEIFDEFEERLYLVLSNALFYLDQAAGEKIISKSNQFISFAGKLMQVLGFAPDLSSCITCGVNLQGVDSFERRLSFENGGFNCILCDQEGGDLNLYQKLLSIKTEKYSALDLKEVFPPHLAQKVFSYLCYQIQMEPKKIKSYSMLF